MIKKQEPFSAVFVKAIDLLDEKNASAKTAKVTTPAANDVKPQERQANNET